MSTRRDLQHLLNDDQTVANLVRLYDKTARQIVKDMAKGISASGFSRATALIARINILIDRLDPRKASTLKRWIAQNIPKAYVLGDMAATAELRKILIAANRNPASIVRGFGAINDASMRGVIASMDLTAARAAETMRDLIGTTIRTTQRTLFQNEAMRAITSKGLLTGASGKEVSDDLARMLVGKPDRATRARLRALGFSNDLLEDFSVIADHKMITVGGRRFNVRSYADLVARTQMREAHTTGTLVRLSQNNVDHVKISRHRQAELDVCTPFAGKVFYIGPTDEDSGGFRSLRELPNGGPPFHPNAHVAGAVIDGCDLQAVSRRYFRGKVVTLETALGHKTTITANHPVATSGGFVAAKLLKVGDRVFSGLDGGGMSFASDHQHGPTEVTQLAELCDQSGKFGTVAIPVRSEHFHGEGEEGQVAVVRIYRELLDEDVPHPAESFEEDAIVGAAGLSLPGIGRLPPGVLRVHRSQTVDGLRGRPDVSHGFEAVASVLTPLLRRLPRHENLPSRGSISKLDTSAEQATVNGGSGHTKFASYLSRTYPGQVEPDHLIRVTVRSFSGHVFSLQASSGLYATDGIIASNCIHVVIPFVVEFKGDEAIANAQEASQAIPTRFLGKTPKEIDALMGEMSETQLEEAFSEGIADVAASKANA